MSFTRSEIPNRQHPQGTHVSGIVVGRGLQMDEGVAPDEPDVGQQGVRRRSEGDAVTHGQVDGPIVEWNKV